MNVNPIETDHFFYSNNASFNTVTKYYSRSSDGDCVFIPNWRALPHHWESFCKELAKKYNVYYFETREKQSYRGDITNMSLSSEVMAGDVISFINHNPFKNYKLILCSFAVPMIVANWNKIDEKPQSVVLICPVKEIHLPKAVRLFAITPAVILPWVANIFYQIVKNIPAFKSICKNQRSIFESTNKNEIFKIHGSVRSILKMNVGLHHYSKISSPVLIIKTKQDPLHNPGISMELNQILENSSLIEIENFRKAHSEEVAQIILNHNSNK